MSSIEKWGHVLNVVKGTRDIRAIDTVEEVYDNAVLREIATIQVPRRDHLFREVRRLAQLHPNPKVLQHIINIYKGSGEDETERMARFIETATSDAHKAVQEVIDEVTEVKKKKLQEDANEEVGEQT